MKYRLKRYGDTYESTTKFNSFTIWLCTPGLHRVFERPKYPADFEVKFTKRKTSDTHYTLYEAEGEVKLKEYKGVLSFSVDEALEDAYKQGYRYITCYWVEQ